MVSYCEQCGKEAFLSEQIVSPVFYWGFYWGSLSLSLSSATISNWLKLARILVSDQHHPAVWSEQATTQRRVLAMTYTAEISRNNPTCFLFLVDQSGSMAEQFGGEGGKSKAQGVADAINRLLQTLVFRCAKGEYILDRYYIGVIGYGSEIRWGFPIEALAGNVLQPVSAIGGNPLRIEERVKRMDDGAGGLMEQRIKFPVWFEPIAQGKTPMCAAIQAAHGLITDFVRQYPTCFPPIVINISDGAANDGHPGPVSDALRGITSQDGNVLLLNAHVSACGERPILFPTHDGCLSDDFSKLLFYMSSPLPPAMLYQARILEATVEEGARGFAFNADLASVIMFLNIGTRVDNNAS